MFKVTLVWFSAGEGGPGLHAGKVRQAELGGRRRFLTDLPFVLLSAPRWQIHFHCKDSPVQGLRFRRLNQCAIHLHQFPGAAVMNDHKRSG